MWWKKEYFGIILILLSLVFIFAAAEGSSSSEVHISGFRILYETFNGDTTEFSDFNELELSDLSDVILEKTTYGKVEFNENLDIMSMDGGDLLVDFDSDLEISSNLINVDEDLLPGINKSANISLYGITYNLPVIYNNGIVCSTCDLISYTGDILKFLTPLFEGAYYAREGGGAVCGDGVCEGDETSVTCPADCLITPPGGGGGGGGGGDTPTNETPIYTGEYDFKLEPEFFSVDMRKGTYYQKIIEVTNNGTSDLTINVFVENLGDFIFPEITGFQLKVGETKKVRLDIYVSDKREADLYIGKVIFREAHVTREVKSILNVQEKAALFDIRTEVLKKYINPGGRIRANISIVNMGDLKNFDIKLTYKIIDFDNEQYTIKEEQFAINKTHNNIFYLDVPEDINYGDYLFYARVLYEEENVSAASFDTFVVESVSYVAWIILILIILVLMYLSYRWYKKRRREIAFKEMKKGEVKEKIEIKKRKLPFKVPKIEEE